MDSININSFQESELDTVELGLPECQNWNGREISFASQKGQDLSLYITDSLWEKRSNSWSNRISRPAASLESASPTEKKKEGFPKTLHDYLSSRNPNLSTLSTIQSEFYQVYDLPGSQEIVILSALNDGEPIHLNNLDFGDKNLSIFSETVIVQGSIKAKNILISAREIRSVGSDATLDVSGKDGQNGGPDKTTHATEGEKGGTINLYIEKLDDSKQVPLLLAKGGKGGNGRDVKDAGSPGTDGKSGGSGGTVNVLFSVPLTQRYRNIFSGASFYLNPKGEAIPEMLQYLVSERGSEEREDLKDPAKELAAKNLLEISDKDRFLGSIRKEVDLIQQVKTSSGQLQGRFIYFKNRLYEIDHSIPYDTGFIFSLKNSDDRFAVVKHDDIYRVEFHSKKEGSNEPSILELADPSLEILIFKSFDELFTKIRSTILNSALNMHYEEEDLISDVTSKIHVDSGEQGLGGSGGPSKTNKNGVVIKAKGERGKNGLPGEFFGSKNVETVLPTSSTGTKYPFRFIDPNQCQMLMTKAKWGYFIGSKEAKKEAYDIYQRILERLIFCKQDHALEMMKNFVGEGEAQHVLNQIISIFDEASHHAYQMELGLDYFGHSHEYASALSFNFEKDYVKGLITDLENFHLNEYLPHLEKLKNQTYATADLETGRLMASQAISEDKKKVDILVAKAKKSVEKIESYSLTIQDQKVALDAELKKEFARIKEHFSFNINDLFDSLGMIAFSPEAPMIALQGAQLLYKSANEIPDNEGHGVKKSYVLHNLQKNGSSINELIEGYKEAKNGDGTIVEEDGGIAKLLVQKEDLMKTLDTFSEELGDFKSLRGAFDQYVDTIKERNSHILNYNTIILLMVQTMKSKKKNQETLTQLSVKDVSSLSPHMPAITRIITDLYHEKRLMLLKAIDMIRHTLRFCTLSDQENMPQAFQYMLPEEFNPAELKAIFGEINDNYFNEMEKIGSNHRLHNGPIEVYLNKAQLNALTRKRMKGFLKQVDHVLSFDGYVFQYADKNWVVKEDKWTTGTQRELLLERRDFHEDKMEYTHVIYDRADKSVRVKKAFSEETILENPNKEILVNSRRTTKVNVKIDPAYHFTPKLESPFAGLADLRVVNVSLEIDGVSNASDSQLLANITHGGDETIVRADGNYPAFNFSHSSHNVPKTLTIEDGKAIEKDANNDMLVQASMDPNKKYALYGPFTNWSIEIENKDFPDLEFDDNVSAKLLFRVLERGYE